MYIIYKHVSNLWFLQIYRFIKILFFSTFLSIHVLIDCLTKISTDINVGLVKMKYS